MTEGFYFLCGWMACNALAWLTALHTRYADRKRWTQLGPARASGLGLRNTGRAFDGAHAGTAEELLADELTAEEEEEIREIEKLQAVLAKGGLNPEEMLSDSLEEPPF